MLLWAMNLNKKQLVGPLGLVMNLVIAFEPSYSHLSIETSYSAMSDYGGQQIPHEYN